jgi:hypothetical protein
MFARKSRRAPVDTVPSPGGRLASFGWDGARNLCGNGEIDITTGCADNESPNFFVTGPGFRRGLSCAQLPGRVPGHPRLGRRPHLSR